MNLSVLKGLRSSLRELGVSQAPESVAREIRVTNGWMASSAMMTTVFTGVFLVLDLLPGALVTGLETVLQLAAIGLVATGRHLAGRVLFMAVSNLALWFFALYLPGVAMVAYFPLFAVQAFLFFSVGERAFAWFFVGFTTLISVLIALGVPGSIPQIHLPLFHGWVPALVVAAAAVQTASGIYQLRREVGLHDLALAVANDRLRRSNNELERFAFVASHDLQRPLRTVREHSDLLTEGYAADLDDQSKLYVDFSTKAAARMQALVKGLLDYGRVGHKQLDLELVSMEALLTTLEADLAVRIEETGANITRGEMHPIWADRQQLGQLVLNLVSNALKFRRPGVASQICISSERQGDDQVVLTVSDNGIGMETGSIHRIFQVFQRLHSRDVFPGTGIGLAVVKKVVDQHAGKLRVESTVGQGSTFFVSLPSQQAAALDVGWTARWGPAAGVLEAIRDLGASSTGALSREIRVANVWAALSGGLSLPLAAVLLWLGESTGGWVVGTNGILACVGLALSAVGRHLLARYLVWLVSLWVTWFLVSYLGPGMGVELYVLIAAIQGFFVFSYQDRKHAFGFTVLALVLGIQAMVGIPQLVAMSTTVPAFVQHALPPLLAITGTLHVAFGASSLQNEIERNDRMLERSHDRLERSNEDLEQFAFVASHDLQEPIRTLLCFTELLQYDHHHAFDTAGQHHIERIREGAQQMHDLVQGLLEFGRVQQVRPEQVSMATLVSDLTQDLGPQIAAASAVLTTGELHDVVGDAGLLRQLVRHLLRNALTFHREGVPPEVHLATALRGSDWMLTVADNGTGMSEAFVRKAFRPFERVPQAGEAVGAGIGLAVVEKIVALHGGAVHLDSELGVGTTISVVLPCVPAPQVV